MEIYRYAYLVGNGMLAIVWLTFFFLRKDLRKQQLFVSCLLAPLALLADLLWFYHDYWRPEYFTNFTVGNIVLGIESPLTGFLTGGISTIIYEVVFRKRHSFGKPRNLMTIIMIFLAFVIMGVLIKIGLNSIWASSSAFILITILGLLIDRDLLKDAILSGALMAPLIIIFYLVWLTIYPKAIQKFWLTEALSGIKLLEIPIEEIVWFCAAGMGAGVLYEFWLNAEKYPQKQR